MLDVKLPEEIESRLEVLVQRTGRSKEYFVREAVLAYLDDLEDIYLAEEVMGRIERGEERTSPLSHVAARLGLAD